MPVLDMITIEGLKSFKTHTPFELRDINIVIGANGSGKSNFLETFGILGKFGDGLLNKHVESMGGAERFLHHGSKATSRITLAVRLSNAMNARISLMPSVGDKLRFASGGVVGWNLPENPGTDPDHPDDDIGVARAFFRKYARDWRVYHLNDTSFSAPIKKTSDINDNRFLREHGGNLASYLFLLKERHPIQYDLIRRTVQLAAPFVDDFILEPLRLNIDTIRLEWRQKDSEMYFGAESFSDGTLRFIVLATLILQPLEYRPSVLLIDEPELGLHPYAINLLASLIKQESPRTQMIVSTQSPQFLDCFEPEDVVVAERVNGATQLRRLDSKSLETWLEDYSLGDLWQKNQFGGQPEME